MFWAQFFGDQDCPRSFERGSISDQFANVVMVGHFKVVLDDDQLAGVCVAQNHICSKRTNWNFSSFKLKIHRKRFADVIRIRSQPGREVSSLVSPNLPQRNLV